MRGLRHQMSRKRRRGFTLFETIVAMFVLLVGLLGIFAVFGSGLNARLLAQEILVSQDLADMWADWVRFRLNDARAKGGALGVLNLVDLATGAQGDFYEDLGDFHFGGGDPRDLPTYHHNVYRGYLWAITQVNRNYTPQYLANNNTELHNWDQRVDGSTVIPSAMGSAPRGLVEVELTIYRGARTYRFNYIFSGVGLKYD